MYVGKKFQLQKSILKRVDNEKITVQDVETIMKEDGPFREIRRDGKTSKSHRIDAKD